jgi:hypothetical protein
MGWTAPQLDRLDRYVRRSHLKLTNGASRQRVFYSLEEALRLAALPGEEEGRIYCFRTIRLAGIPANAARAVWMERVQQTLSALAAQAVHASHPSAAGAAAVYFHNEEEALETLLRQLVLADAAPQWYFTSVLGTSPETGRAAQIRTVLERLRQPSMPAGAAAAIVLEAIGASDPAPLLAAIPDVLARDWLRELEPPKILAAEPPPIVVPERFAIAIERAAAHFGWRDPRTVWLAVQVAICLAPATAASGTALKAARAALRTLEAAQAPLARRIEGPAQRSARPLVFDEESEPAQSNAPVERASLSASRIEPIAPATGDVGEAPASKAAENRVELPPALNPLRDEDEPPRAIAREDSAVSPNPAAPLEPVPAALPRQHASSPALLGEPTRAVGLFFLLPALRRLGIVAALDAHPPLREASFVEHILKRIAAQAGVTPGDPILVCLHPEDQEFHLPETLPSGGAIWPANLVPPRNVAPAAERLLRIWVLAVRRWCWRMGQIPVREIVLRPGRVWLTRTDLDVTLPLADAEIRIRRIGLDIDPGWLPWFGNFGRVVRFHYREREPGGAA